MKENKEIEAVVSDVDKNGTKTFEVKKEKIYKRKDLITTAIIAFLIGAVLTTGGFAISKGLKGGRKDRDFRPNEIQRNIDQDNLNNGQNDNRGRMNRRGNMPNNEQQPNNSNATPSVPNNNDQNTTANKS